MIIFDYCWLFLIVFDYFWLFLIIFDYFWLFLIIVDYFWLFLIIFDYCWLFLIIFDYCWLLLIIFDYFLDQSKSFLVLVITTFLVIFYYSENRCKVILLAHKMVNIFLIFIVWVPLHCKSIEKKLRIYFVKMLNFVFFDSDADCVTKTLLGRVRILIKTRLKIKFDIFPIVNLSKFIFNRVLISIRTRPWNNF